MAGISADIYSTFSIYIYELYDNSEMNKRELNITSQSREFLSTSNLYLFLIYSDIKIVTPIWKPTF
jgi:hypothetical protein